MRVYDSAVSLDIRAARGDDWPRIRPLLEGMGRVDPARLDRRFASVAGAQEHCLVVAEVDGTLVGYAWAQDR